MKPQYLPLSLAVGVALLAAPAFAREAATDLDGVVVTGTRTEVAVEDSLVPVQVIDRAAIERSQAISLPDLLQGRAGINLTQQGGPGKLTSLFLRGTESDHVLLLVDGMRVGSVSSGMPALQDLPIDQIERVEIVRGPRSSLYGSEAIGGVIQVFTRAAGPGLRQDVALGVGSHGLRQASAGLSNRGERGWVSARAGYQETDGIDACRGTAAGWGAGCFADEPDRDGYRNASVNLRAGLALTDTLRVEGHLLDASSFNEYDGSVFGGNEAENRQQVLGGRLDWQAGERVALRAQFGRGNDDADSYFAEGGARSLVSVFDTRRDQASLQADVGFGSDQLLSAGLDWQEDRITSTTAFDADNRDNLGGFVEYQGRFGAHTLQASVRNDDNEQFGNHSTGSLGYGLALGNGWRLTASAGTGFKAPTFNDLYYPGFSNPDLRPEESRSANLGVAQYGDGWNWTFNVFDTRIERMIGYDVGFNLVNIDRARLRGAELTGFATLAGVQINAELSHVDPRNDSDGINDGNWLPRRARNTGRVDLDRAFGALKLGISAKGASHRYDDVANGTRLAGHGTVDLRVEYALARDWTLQARASNVFDRRYETIAWYNQPGREYGLNLRWQSAR
ncbi:TonB-dependent vitamin B12 receptor [Pseudoxanthomonas broegbernensis]|uniref:TonB-dependent vitamin B12 receptor n=1 Tax=Pseudoxanthomonas broegbernensis TaxID=83619 RepID=A0A7V8GMQ9_9GAMM|nr:TonB-dependent vitamin B12 receptor [Pseudoxanthomonas broegbernensis]KAF1686649.1 TonB-dependent vitamin B12 receptor [Pseudoxanthomonas broegbernensis]MBB6063594.1 vitamin B12 transporter [Pseudoxanthomonas broegbernensis]